MRTARITGPSSLGMVLREARVMRGLTQQALSEELGVSKRYIIEMEQGKPTKAIERLFDYLRETGVTIHGDISEDVD
jgi:HTH-type transcriptional regulator / antitoxin HipB